MTRTLRRIAPLQLGKMLAALYGLISLIFIPFLLLAGVVGAFAPNAGKTPGAAITITIAIVMMIFVPIIYAIMGFLGGLLGAWLYNVIAARIGGIQLEVE
jgi:hypothetical protein